jgi:hypothetical protein
MHRPDCHQLTKANVVDGVSVPEPHRQYTSVVGKLDLEIALRSFELLARLRYIVEVHDAAHESEVARAGLKVT